MKFSIVGLAIALMFSTCESALILPRNPIAANNVRNNVYERDNNKKPKKDRKVRQQDSSESSESRQEIPVPVPFYPDQTQPVVQPIVQPIVEPIVQPIVEPIVQPNSDAVVYGEPELVYIPIIDIPVVVQVDPTQQTNLYEQQIDPSLLPFEPDY